VGEPVDPAEAPLVTQGLTGGPFLVKVDRYGSVSGLVKVKVPLGVLVIVPWPQVEDSFYGS